MKNRLKITALILALLCAASLFCACSYPRSEETETESAIASPTETEKARDPVRIHAYDPDNVIRAKAYLEEAPGGDLGGMDIFISGPSAAALSPDGATYISKEISDRTAPSKKNSTSDSTSRRPRQARCSRTPRRPSRRECITPT